MQSGSEMEGQENEGFGQEPLDMGSEGATEASHGDNSEEGGHDPLYVQKRLKQQQRAHQRQMNDLRNEMQSMREQVSVNANNSSNGHAINPYVSPGQPTPPGIDENIHKAVTYALGHRDQAERQAKEQAGQQHIARQYQDLNRHLDGGSEKYDDFDEVVRGDAPFTPHMRDAALMLPKKGSGSAREVLYKLGKNPEELKRIGQLHPLDQAAEMVRLSHALVGGDEKPRSESQHNALGSVKSNPVTNSASITDKTSPGDIRRRMKAGTFK